MDEEKRIQKRKTVFRGLQVAENLKIVTWKWDAGLHPKKGIRYTAEHVNALYWMLSRHLHIPFQLVCITDDSGGINEEIECLPLWKEWAELPGCFRRLKIFSKEMADIIGPRFVCIDLDVVIVDDVTDIFTRTEDFIIWGEYHRKTPYCGSFFIMDAGCRESVYRSFDFKKYPPNLKGKYPYGTDQDHISHRLYPYEVMLTEKDGIYAFNFAARRWEKGGTTPVSKYKRGKHQELFFEAGGRIKQLYRPRYHGNGNLPEDARMIFFNGKFDPSQPFIQNEYPWVKKHWKSQSRI
jgi:hypothetical protein